MSLKVASRLLAGLAVLGLGWWGWRWWRSDWIPAGHVGVIYDASGGLQKRVLTPRRVLVGWRQQLYIYPTKLMAAIYTQDPTEGEVKAADGIQITTADNANTVFDVAVFYRVQPADVFKIFEAFGPLPIEEIQTTHVRRATRDAVNAVGTRYDAFSLIGPKRQEASAAATEALRGLLGPKGITVEQVLLGPCYPEPEFQGKIMQRVNAYTELEISELRRQIAEVERDTARVRNRAEAQARQLSAAKTGESSLEMLRLEADREAIEKWNGQLPLTQARPGQVIYLDKGLLESVRGGQ
jgi:regulator of protease activity HflC (stomatin/prohibitin superfamily)